MSLQDQILSDGRTVKGTLEHLIGKHMPSAAVASGWVSSVDVSATVMAAVACHQHEKVVAWTVANGAGADCSLGLMWVKDYCAAHGLPTSDTFAKPFRMELMKCRMRDEAAKLHEANP